MALAIFAMASLMLASAYLNIVNSYETAARAAATDADLDFARSLVLRQPDRTKVEEGGNFEGADGRQIRWSAEILSTNMPDLFTVVFTCEMAGAGPDAERETTVQTFTVLRPTWSIDTAERDKLREEAKTRILEMQVQET